MLSFDPQIVNQDKIRMNKRKKLIKVATAPTLIIIIIALFFGRTGIFNLLVSIESSNNQWNLAPNAMALQTLGNIIEPYLVYYDEGYYQLVTATSSEDLDKAEESLRKSLQNNPPVEMLCSIYGNMSYIEELKADELVQAKDYNEALVVYNKAEALLYENNCASRDEYEIGIDEMSEIAKERIEEKRRQAVEAANQEPDDDQPDEPNNNEPDIDNQTIQNIQNLHDQNTGEGVSQLLYMQQVNNGGTYDYNSPNY